MADAIISSVAQRVIAIAEEKIRGEVRLVKGVKKELLKLSKKLKMIRNVLEDAERRGVKDKSVRGWLKKLEDTAYKMDDILDEWNYYGVDASAEKSSSTEKVCSSSMLSSCLCFKKVVVRRDTAKKIQNVKALLDEILKEKNEFNFVTSTMRTTDSAPRVETTSSIDLEKVQGENVEKNKNDIVGKLVTDGGRQILSIVGMGGIGKTTLAQLVYNDNRVKEYFDCTIWICVSDPFDVVGIASKIVENVEKVKPPNTNQLEVILQKLRDCISGKKFLLVLDDVWNEDYKKWEPLEINLNYGTSSSKILVTTRNVRVAKMMGTYDDEIYSPKQLTDDECWSLLRRISLRGKDERGEFENVGKKIATKCRGLPLAIIVLGSVLQFKNSLEEWINVLESEFWMLDERETDLYPHLLLSYNELSPTLKRCFSYCAVYPKDVEVVVESLIQQWMALGYLGSVAGDPGVELKGRDYFNNLAMRSLLQDFKKCDLSNEISLCKMHDIIHDFAQFLKKNDKLEDNRIAETTCQVCDPVLVAHAQEYRSLFWDKYSSPNLCTCLRSLRVLGLRSVNGIPHGIEKLIHLRWLDMSYATLSKEDLETICKLYYLQTLFLACCSLIEIPEEIGNLVHLRHLDLSYIFTLKELPDSMCKLVDLKTLNMACLSLYRLPKGLAQLSGIRSLNEFHGGSSCNKLGFLKNLNGLSGYLKLVIFVSSSKEFVEDAREAKLKNKIHLQHLDLYFCDKRDELECLSSSSSLWLDIIEALEPNQNLQVLGIFGYEGSRFPRWISSPLNLVRRLMLHNFREVSSLPLVGKLPFLEELDIQLIKKLNVLGVEWLDIRGGKGEIMDTQSLSIVVFPKLKTLAFSECHEWWEWEDITAEEEESASMSVMPYLTELHVIECGRLKKLPHCLLRKASSLMMLKISGSTELIQVYGDKHGSPWRSISLHNRQLQLQCNSNSNVSLYL